MKSWILIVSYLWKDTWSRWLEQPSSVLARLFVGALLAMVATVILVAFTLMERNLRERMESFGLNTMVVREMVSSSDPEFVAHGNRPDRLAPLAENGRTLRLRQLYMRAQTELQSDVVVLTYSPEAISTLAPWLGVEAPLIYVSERFPEGVQVRVSVSRQTGDAIVRQAGTFFRPLGFDNFVLAPVGWALDAERAGFIDTTIFHRETEGIPMERFVEGVRALYAMDRRNPPQLQSALPMLRELEDLQGRQKQWRGLLAGVLGLTMALVYGSIAILEFRQNLYTSALLRSLGAPGRVLYFRQWLENIFLANLAALGAIGLVAVFHTEIFGTLGFTRSVLDVSQANPYWSFEIGLVLLCVNAGAFLSSLPVAVGLRRPVGSILN
jgi:hypothetical protein